MLMKTSDMMVRVIGVGLSSGGKPARAPEAAKSSYINYIAIHRIDDEASDVFGIAESHVFPTLAAIDRLIDAVTPR